MNTKPKPKFYYGAVTLDRVIDGDTVRLVIDLGFGITRATQPYRLARIDAPEMDTPEGHAARGALEQYLITSTDLLHIESLGPDKYGRWLIELWAGTTNINDWLLEHKYALPYAARLTVLDAVLETPSKYSKKETI